MAQDNMLPPDIQATATVLANKMASKQIGDLQIQFRHATMEVVLKNNHDISPSQPDISFTTKLRNYFFPQ